MSNQTSLAPSGGTLGPSLVRTAVPFLAGLLGTWLLKTFGLDVDSATATALVSAGIGYVYYVVVRFLEVYGSDKWGYILGFRKQPTYVPAGEAAAIVKPDVSGKHQKGETGAVDLGLIGIALVVGGLVGLVVSVIAGSAVSLVVFAVLIVVGVLLVAVGGPRRVPRL